MYAIVVIAGKQYRVEKNQNIKVPFLNKDSGGKVEFDRILFLNNEKGENVFGDPLVKGMKVSATVVENGRDKKIIVFKKKRRKGYQVKNGHRQQFSLIKIDDIGKGTVAKTPAAKKETPKAKPTANKVETEKPVKVTQKKEAAPTKSAEKKTTTEKKPVAKKATATTKAKPAAKKATTEKKSTPAKRATTKKQPAKKDKPAEEKEA